MLTISEEEHIWEFIPISDYNKPTYIFEQTFKTKFPRIMKKISRSKVEDVFLTDLDKLKEFPEAKLNRVVSVPDLTEPIKHLDSTLFDWLKAKPTTDDIIFVINQPYSYTQEIVTNWATKNKIPIISKPNNDQILDQSFDFTSQFMKAKSNVFVIPNFEKFYLRHYNGLTIIRNLFLYLWSNEIKTVICVNSWSWVYLKKVLEIDSFGVEQLVLAPFNYTKFEKWFKTLKKDLKFRKIVFRKADDGNYVIEPNSLTEKDKKGIKIDYNFLKNLTAYSEGIPKIAWTIWRYSLRIEPDDEFYDKNDDIDENIDPKKLLTTWVIPWERLKLPGKLDDVKRSELLILQSILLHDGLDECYLEKILPLTQSEVMLSLNVLKSSNLIKKDKQEWKVTPVSYAYVKKLLTNYGFFNDNF